MMEASKLALLKQNRLKEAEAFLALSSDEGRGLPPEKLSALRAASRFRVRRHTCDPSQGDEDVWLHDKIMAACSGEGFTEQESIEGAKQGAASAGEAEQEIGSTSPHQTQAAAHKSHALGARAPHLPQTTKPETRRGPNKKGPSRPPAQHPDRTAAVQRPDHAAAQQPLPDQVEADSKGPGQPSSGDADMAAAEEEQWQQELSRGEEALQELKDMQSATAAELEAKRKAIPRQSVTYTLDTQMLQAEFMVANGMHLPGQDAYPFSKLLYDDDWRFAPALPQRTKGMYRPFSYAGDEAEFLDGQGSSDGRPSDPGPADSLSFDSSPSSPCPPLPLLQMRSSAPNLFSDRSGPSSTSPKRRPPKDAGRSLKPRASLSNSNNVWQAFSGAPAGMAAVQSGVTSSFIARVPPLVPRSSISDSGGLQVQGELQETGEDDAARQSPRKQRGLPVPVDALQPLLHLSPPSPPVQRHSSQPQPPPAAPTSPAPNRSSVDSDPKTSQSQPHQLPQEPQAPAELHHRQQKQVKLPPLIQKGEPVHRHKAGNARGAQAKKSLHITGWVQTGGGMNHRLLSGKKSDKAG